MRCHLAFGKDSARVETPSRQLTNLALFITTMTTIIVALHFGKNNKGLGPTKNQCFNIIRAIGLAKWYLSLPSTSWTLVYILPGALCGLDFHFLHNCVGFTWNNSVEFSSHKLNKNFLPCLLLMRFLASTVI